MDTMGFTICPKQKPRHHCSCIDLDKVKLKFDHFDVDKSGVAWRQVVESLDQCFKVIL